MMWPGVWTVCLEQALAHGLGHTDTGDPMGPSSAVFLPLGTCSSAGFSPLLFRSTGLCGVSLTSLTFPLRPLDRKRPSTLYEDSALSRAVPLLDVLSVVTKAQWVLGGSCVDTNYATT